MKVTTEDTKKAITKTKIILKSPIETLRIYFDGALTLMEQRLMFSGHVFNNKSDT